MRCLYSYLSGASCK